MPTSRFNNCLRALAILPFATLTSAAYADMTGVAFDDDFGSGDVKVGYAASADLTYCDEAQLAEAASAPLVCPVSHPVLGCLAWVPDPAVVDCLTGATEAYAKAQAYASGWVKLFGQKESVSATASAITEDGASSIRYRVRTFGTTAYDSTQSNVFVGKGASFEESKNFSLVGLSIKVKGEVGAYVGAFVGGGAIANGAQITVTPTVAAGVDASASVGAVCASVSVSGNIDALSLALPTDLWVSYVPGTLTYGIDTDFDYDVLIGSLKLKANACGPSASLTIASYGGWNGGFSVLHEQGTKSL